MSRNQKELADSFEKQSYKREKPLNKMQMRGKWGYYFIKELF